MAEDMQSDVVELIIAVDLDPTDPAEPINVSDVAVRDKGEGVEGEGGEDWQGLLMQLLEAEGITDGPVSFAEASELVANRMPRQPEEDPFAKAQMMDEPTEEPEPSGEGFMAVADRARKKRDEDEE